MATTTQTRPSLPPATAPAPDRSRRHCLLATVALALQAAASLPSSASPVVPEQPRRLEYRVAWNGIPAAGATVEIRPTELAGRDSMIVEATARTNAFVDLFWTFRGTARATMLADDLTPIHFVYDRQMAGTPYLTWIDFEPSGARSVFIKGSRRRELQADGDVLDPITAVFRARLSGARPGDVLRYEVWTGESRYRVELSVKDPEPIDVPAGRFNALRVEPAVWKLGGEPARDSRLRAATIWVADDAARTLLRIRGELFIGAVTLDLTKVEPAA